MGCGDACPVYPEKNEDWDLKDPTGKYLTTVRLIRDEIRQRVEKLFSGLEVEPAHFPDRDSTTRENDHGSASFGSDVPPRWPPNVALPAAIVSKGAHWFLQPGRCV